MWASCSFRNQSQRGEDWLAFRQRRLPFRSQVVEAARPGADCDDHVVAAVDRLADLFRERERVCRHVATIPPHDEAALLPEHVHADNEGFVIGKGIGKKHGRHGRRSLLRMLEVRLRDEHPKGNLRALLAQIALMITCYVRWNNLELT